MAEVNRFNPDSQRCDWIEQFPWKDFKTEKWKEADFLINNVCDAKLVWDWILVMKINWEDYYIWSFKSKDSNHAMNMLDAKMRIAYSIRNWLIDVKDLNWKSVVNWYSKNVRLIQSWLRTTNDWIIYITKGEIKK